MEYIIVAIIIIWGAIFNKRYTSQTRKVYLIVIWLIMTLLMGLRYRVGIDTMNYMQTYKFIPTFQHFNFENFDRYRFEPLFLLINIFCKSYLGDFWTVQTVCAAITNGCIIIFINRYCNNPFIGVLLYFYIAFLYFSTEIMRESIAVSIFLLNYRNIEKNNYTKYYLFSFLSIGFHYSAFIIWIVPLTKYLKLNIFYIFMLVGIMSITPFANTLNEMMLFASVNDRMDLYIDGNNLNLNYRIGVLIQNAVPGILAWILLNKYKQPIIFKQMFLLQILFCAGTFAIPIVFQRFINYTQLFTIVLMASCIYNKKVSKYLRIALIIVILISQSQFYYTMLFRWVPYVSILDPYHIIQREIYWRTEYI